MLKPQRWTILIMSMWLLAACMVSLGRANSGSPGGNMAGMMRRHMAPLPAAYAGLRSPIPDDADSRARGQEIYLTHCVTCHGEQGWGDGPAAATLKPPPAPIAHTAQMLSDAYLFYRISEGGSQAPFNSAMPAFKQALDETDRWNVINYIRSFDTGVMNRGMNCMGGGQSPDDC